MTILNLTLHLIYFINIRKCFNGSLNTLPVRKYNLHTMIKADRIIPVFSFRYLSSQIGVLCAAVICIHAVCGVLISHQQTYNAFPPHSAVTDPQSYTVSYVHYLSSICHK